jgi:hypothetical protein
VHVRAAEDVDAAHVDAGPVEIRDSRVHQLLVVDDRDDAVFETPVEAVLVSAWLPVHGTPFG